MRRAIHSIVGTLLATAIFATPAVAQTPPETTVATSDATVTFTITDVAFDGPDCVKTPVTISYTKNSTKSTQIGLTVNLNQTAANNGIGGTWSSGFTGPLSQTGIATTLTVCPQKVDVTRGPLLVSGNLNTYGGPAGNVDAPVPASTVNLTYNPTQMTKPKVKRAPYGITDAVYVTGDATATTLTKGTVPAGGTLVLQVKKPGQKAWISGGKTGVDKYGEYQFRLLYAEKYPKGTRFRVALTDCGWCLSNLSKPTRG